MRTLPLSLIFLSLLLQGCTTTPPRSEEPANGSPVFREVSSLARRLVSKTPVKGLSLVLVDESGVIGAAGFGDADPAEKISATEHTVYRAGSLAKLFTATAIMQLSERGRLDIDNSVNRYLPAFAIPERLAQGRPITARDLLSHQSGLPCDIDQGMWSRTPFQKVVERLRAEVAPYPPGYVTSYSNVGYSVLGDVVQNVTGEAFDRYLEREVLKPLDMGSTGYATDAPEGVARGYRHGKPGELLPIRDTPAMGLYTTASDLGRYLNWLLSDEDTVLSRTAREAMWTPQNEDIALDFDSRVGLAWLLDEGRLGYAGRVARHGGHTPRFTAEIAVLPDHRLGVAVLANSGNAEGVIRLLAERALGIALKAKKGLQPPPAAKPPAVDQHPIPKEAAGRYASEFGILRIEPIAKRIHTETLKRSFPLVSYADGSFGADPRALVRARDPRLRALAKIRLTVRRKNERQFLLAYVGNRIQLFGERVPALKDEDRAWQTRLGNYRVANADAKFPVEELALSQREATLYLQYRLPAVSKQLILRPVAPIDENHAITLGVGRSREVLTVDEGTETLRFSGYRAVRVN